MTSQIEDEESAANYWRRTAEYIEECPVARLQNVYIGFEINVKESLLYFLTDIQNSEVHVTYDSFTLRRCEMHFFML